MSIVLSKGNEGNFFTLGESMEDEADGQEVTVLVLGFTEHDEVGV